MEKTRDLFKKIRDTKGVFHAKIGSIKNRNGMDLTEASACNAEDLGLIPGSGRSPGEGNVKPLQPSGLENSMDYIVAND